MRGSLADAMRTLRRAVLTSVVTTATLAALGAGRTNAAESPWANVADPVFQRIDQTALPHPAVYAVTQDDRGFLWIGTPAGLARYDGYELRSYVAGAAHPEAPPSAEMLLVDGGQLWIGTLSSGLAALDLQDETFRSWPPDPAARSGPRSASVIALQRDTDGRLLVGGDGGLDLFDPRSGRFTPAPLPTDAANQPRVEAVLVDRAGVVWVATLRGLFRRARGETDFRRFSPTPDPASTTRGFFSLCEDGASNLWVGARDEVLVLDGERRLLRSYASGAAPDALARGEHWGIVEATPGLFWVGTYGGGISIVDDRARRVRRMPSDRANPGGLTPGDLWRFFRDRSGLLWLANGPGGLLAHNPRNRGIFQLATVDKGLGAGDLGARAVAADRDGRLWLGGDDRVVLVDPRRATTRSFEVPGRGVQTLHAAADDTLWIGTVHGLCRLLHGAATVDCPDGPYQTVGRVFAVLARGDTLWVGTAAGLFTLDQRSGALTHYSRDGGPQALSNDFVWVLAADRQGRVWAGTRNGLNRIDPKTGEVLRLLHDPADARSLGPGSISSLLVDRRGSLWVGAVGGPVTVLTERADGIFFIRRLSGPTATTDKSASSTPENVHGLAEGPDGRIWAAATSTVAIVDPVLLTARLLGRAEGVEEVEFWTRATTQASDGTIFFAGTHAVTVIAPEAHSEWTWEPPVVVTALRVGGREVPVAALASGRVGEQTPGNAGAAPTIELPAGERDISVEFAALDYSAPGALRYEYSLEGHRPGWVAVDAAHRVATFTNLPPGDYTLRVRGSNRLGAWSPVTLALAVRALPAWYETWWFRALLALLAGLLVVAIVRARTAVLHRRAERLAAVVAERTHELAEANAALEAMTITDPLTGLRNRRFFLQRVDEDVALALRQGTDLVFFLVDVDHFKKVNDELGHAAGDRVLQQMRPRLEQVFRSTDYLLRWGGEEFLAVARGSRRQDAAEIAERLRATIAGTPFDLDGGQTLAKTASIGFAAFPFVSGAAGALGWTQVVELADQALYMAKRGGRNTWVGLLPTAATDPVRLAGVLASAPEEAVAKGALAVVRAEATAAVPTSGAA